MAVRDERTGVAMRTEGNRISSRRKKALMGPNEDRPSVVAAPRRRHTEMVLQWF
jgi:hypothetical protein